ncbi:alpha/beta fold hydrolase [Aggregicoccus sp. 17bor-14]|uniref:alpha/beta fold hydrolase n=1 Tax=Myxococcaceae TaxID=31 RepID=UPI00129D0E26|nr:MULTISPECIES: alpha/beta hydrolase [Myxococcaceae]MBF5041686.1 alpha/beta fold hydrolase [Simulacricoccus sp. 17bor-14]MRI87468.1 alpha/beta fold hydrolase [Aggregicoccus sp. 17bor-14]
MPMLAVNGTQLYCEDSGGSGEPVVFSHGLLWSTELFEPQVQALRGRYRCIAYDHRGQGRSAKPGGHSVPIETVYEDAVALIEKLGVGPCHFVGLSMGGFVGMRLAARRPDLVRSLALLETSAEPEPPQNAPRYRAMATVARFLGVRLLASRVMPIMFGKSFLTDPARAEEREAWRQRLLKNERSIYRAVLGVVEREPIESELGKVKAPTLVLVGAEDVATVPAKAERIHSLIAGSKLVKLPRGGHSSTVEEPALVNQALSEFLAQHSGGHPSP